MEVEEAIRLVEIAFGYSSSIHDGWKDDEVDRGCWNPDDEAEKIAIEAMKKQIPMNPIRMGKNLYCPTCDKWLLWDDAIPNEWDNHCGKCGQRLKWED